MMDAEAGVECADTYAVIREAERSREPFHADLEYLKVRS
jgi:hypothetical protein